MFNASSFSELDTFGRCSFKHMYRYMYRLQPKVIARPLRQGTMGHRFMKAAFLAEQANEDVMAWLDDEEQQILHDEAAPIFTDLMEEYATEVSDIKTMVIEWWLNKKPNTWEVLHVEEEFLIKTDKGHVITFTPDLVIRDVVTGGVWIIDHKFVTTIPTESPYGDLQALLYLSGVRALYPETVGFKWNYLRKKAPTQPRLNKDGSISNLNRVDTTYEVLRDFAIEHGQLDAPGVRERLAELQGQEKFFKIIEFTPPDWVLDTMEYELENRVQVMDHVVANNLQVRTYSTNWLDGCDNCGYNALCRAELFGGDTKRVIEDMYQPLDLSYKTYDTEE